MKAILSALILAFLPVLHAFAPNRCTYVPQTIVRNHHECPLRTVSLHMIGQKRRDELGIGDDEDEYDLDVALNTNTDPFITKVIAGSFILVMIALLVYGLVIPSLTDYGEGVCSPIQSGGRC